MVVTKLYCSKGQPRIFMKQMLRSQENSISTDIELEVAKSMEPSAARKAPVWAAALVEASFSNHNTLT